MGAFLSLDFVKTIVEIGILFIGYLEGLLLPNKHGACALLPKVIHQLKELEYRKATEDEDFPGSDSSYSLREKCNWMKKIHDVRPIGQIIWPGTHYSATNKIGIPYITRPFGQRQTMSIYEQLLNGVRALDIRVQQDGLVCYGRKLCHTTMVDIIKDIRLFFEKAKFEIIILEIQTERGFTDPDNFEGYLVEELGDLLIHQDDQVFSKSISEVLPRRIICIWKPVTGARKPRRDGPLWSAKYLKCDEIDTQMPLTKFDGNIKNLTSWSLASKKKNFFYKVENTLNPRTSTILESLLIWPKHGNVLSKRINGFAKSFLAKCHNDGILHRLQICSVDFVDDDFVSACIGLNYEILAKEETRLLKNISNSNGSNNSIYGVNCIQDIKTNEIDTAALTWEEYVFIWIKPNTLKITQSGDDKCWRWVPYSWLLSKYNAAKAIELYSLHVSCDSMIDTLPQGIRYEVFFRVQMLDSAFGWESPILLRLILPDGSIQENRVFLDLTSTYALIAGTFVMSRDMRGEVTYSLEQLDSSMKLKGGIILHGVIIQPSFVDIVIARDLSINSDDVGRCWAWFTESSRSAKRWIELAKLISVRNFKVRGQFYTGKLLSGCTYRVGFMIKMLSGATGWETPTKLTLLLADGRYQQRRGSFEDMPAHTEIKIYVGEFKMSSELVGKLEFSMENNSEVEKSGMVIEVAFIEQRH